MSTAPSSLQLQQDADFQRAPEQEKIAYLSHVDPDFAKAERADQVGYLKHVSSPQTLVNQLPAAPQMGADTTPKNYGFTAGNMLRNAGQGIKELVGGAAGMAKDALDPRVNLVEGPDSLLNKYVMNPADREAKMAQTAPNASESIGHSVAEAIPVIGPWAASLGEQAGTGDIGGATAKGAAQILAPKAVGALGKLAVKGPGQAAAAMLGAGEDAVRQASEVAGEKEAGKQAAFEEKTKEAVDQNRQALAKGRQAAGNVAAGQDAAAQAAQHGVDMAKLLPEAHKAVRASAQAMYPEIEGSASMDEVRQGVQEAADTHLAGEGPLPTSMARILKGAKELTEREQFENYSKGESVSFRDLHGMYSELGQELYNRDLPGDSYQAVKAARDFIGDKMKGMADEEGKGEDFSEAQKNWAKYENTFNNNKGAAAGGSPIAKALRSRDPVTGALRPDFVRDALTNDKTYKVAKELLNRFPESQPLVAKLDALKQAHDAAKSAPKQAMEKGAPVSQLPSMKQMPEPPQAESFDPEEWRKDQVQKGAIGWQRMSPMDFKPFRLPFSAARVGLGHLLAQPAMQKYVNWATRDAPKMGVPESSDKMFNRMFNDENGGEYDKAKALAEWETGHPEGVQNPEQRAKVLAEWNKKPKKK